MSKYLFNKAIVLVVLFSFFFIFLKAEPFIPGDTSAPKNEALQFIDPTIGNVAQLLEPTRPTAHLPNQVVRIYPLRKDYLDDQISGFPLTVVSHRLGEVFCIRPTVQEINPESWEQKCLMIMTSK